MTRLIVFLGFCLSLTLIISLTAYKNKAISNEKFDYAKEKTAYKKMRKKIESLKHPVHHEEKKEEEASIKAFIVKLTSPELENGYKVYKKCVVCHGKEGQGKKSQNAPRIGGQMAWYLEKQIKDMRSGVRSNPKMLPYIKRLSGSEIKNVSNYLSQFPW